MTKKNTTLYFYGQNDKKTVADMTVHVCVSPQSVYVSTPIFSYRFFSTIKEMYFDGGEKTLRKQQIQDKKREEAKTINPDIVSLSFPLCKAATYYS